MSLDRLHPPNLELCRFVCLRARKVHSFFVVEWMLLDQLLLGLDSSSYSASVKLEFALGYIRLSPVGKVDSPSRELHPCSTQPSAFSCLFVLLLSLILLCILYSITEDFCRLPFGITNCPNRNRLGFTQLFQSLGKNSNVPPDII
jgi:hypothetical protein